MIPSLRLTLLGFLALTAPAVTQAFTIPDGLSETERKRFERFETFQIKGVCSDHDLARLAERGVNTVRGYTLDEPAVMRQKLDNAHRMGLKMVVSEWMPHHGKNKNKDGYFWDFDYNQKSEEMIANLIRKVEGIGDHPAILMWGLGNEVHLEEPYLRTVNRMSQEIHKRFPLHLTSLTMVNAKPEHIQKIKEFAPDIDVLGIQCYSRGAVRGGIKNAEKYWGKPFYMSEFNTNGPWNFGKTEWGVELDETVTKKANDLKDCYVAIDESKLCLGSTVFVWGHYSEGGRPTYFSLLLDANPEGTDDQVSFDNLLTTPQADVMTEHFTGQPIRGNRAPVLSQLEFADGAKSRLARPGEPMPLRLAAEDSNGDAVEFVAWIIKAKTRKTITVAGPIKVSSNETAAVNAPSTPGEYLVMVYAIDNKGGASASVLPFKVPEPMTEAQVSAVETTKTQAVEAQKL
ncbi:MAG: hypothetical protein RIQ79_2482 [Verrucomicrobiota bacterium]